MPSPPRDPPESTGSRWCTVLARASASALTSTSSPARLACRPGPPPLETPNEGPWPSGVDTGIEFPGQLGGPIPHSSHPEVRKIARRPGAMGRSATAGPGIASVAGRAAPARIVEKRRASRSAWGIARTGSSSRTGGPAPPDGRRAKSLVRSPHPWPRARALAPRPGIEPGEIELVLVAHLHPKTSSHATRAPRSARRDRAGAAPRSTWGVRLPRVFLSRRLVLPQHRSRAAPPPRHRSVIGRGSAQPVTDYGDRRNRRLFVTARAPRVLPAAAPGQDPAGIAPALRRRRGRSYPCLAPRRGAWCAWTAGDVPRPPVAAMSDVTREVGFSTRDSRSYESTFFVLSRSQPRGIIFRRGDGWSFPADRVATCIASYGNTSAAEHPDRRLAEASTQGRLGTGSRVWCSSAFGRFFTWGAGIVIGRARVSVDARAPAPRDPFLMPMAKPDRRHRSGEEPGCALVNARLPRESSPATACALAPGRAGPVGSTTARPAPRGGAGPPGPTRGGRPDRRISVAPKVSERRGRPRRFSNGFQPAELPPVPFLVPGRQRPDHRRRTVAAPERRELGPRCSTSTTAAFRPHPSVIVP